MEGGIPTGTVTALSSVFPAQEAEKAAKRVVEAIAERNKELGHLQRFVADNTNLINLIHKLPEELSHPIMVPFGKAAFFPGRLIHTNEFLVLLGEGYNAERTAKQTDEILKRRGKSLESQIESLKAMMQDLEAEASFFNATASEAAEGLVEVREEYIEEPSTEKQSESAPINEKCCLKTAVLPRETVDSSLSDGQKLIREDEEYARIMARLDELEKEEEAACNSEEDDSDSNIGFCDHQLNESIELMGQQLPTSTKKLLSRNGSEPNQTEPFIASKLEVEDLRGHPVKDDLPGKRSALHTGKATATERLVTLSQPKEKDQILAAKIQDPESDVVGPTLKSSVNRQKDPESDVVGSTLKSSVNRQKAFTGSVVEHSHGIPSNPPAPSSPSSQVAPSSNPSKPVSRFKMQRGNR